MTGPTNPNPAPADPAGPGAPPEPPTPPEGDQETELRDDPEKAALKSEAAKWRRALREREQELEQLKLASATDAERAVAAAKAEGEAVYRSKWRRSLVDNAALSILSERGVAASDLALRSLELDDIDVDGEGKFDRMVIAAKVEELISRYPVLLPGQPPSLPKLSGDSQHRVVNPVKHQGTSDKDVEQLFRYGLGAG